MSESNVKPELKRALTDLLDQEAKAIESHPNPEGLWAYRAGELSAEEEESLREHLTRCRDCVDILLLDPANGADGAVDLETFKAWREMRALVRRIEAQRELRRQRNRTRFYQIAAAACLALAVAGLVYREAPQTALDRPQPRQPTANVEIFDVTRSIQRGVDRPRNLSGPEEIGSLATPIAVSNWAEALALVFVVPPGDFDSHELEIIDAGGDEIWSTKNLVVKDAHATIKLPSGFLKAGSYRIRILGKKETAPNQVWEYPIELTITKDAGS